MADNATVNGYTWATKDRGNVHYQLALVSGASSATHGVLTVTTTPTALVAANGGRRVITLQNLSAVRIRFGFTSTIGAVLGPYIEAGDSYDCEYTGTIYFAVDSGTAQLAYADIVS